MPDAINQLPEPGGYISLFKVIVFLIFMVPWLWVSPWVYTDAKHVRTHMTAWCLTVLGAGMLGALVWLILPIYVVGLIIYVVLAASALGAYAIYRNGRVEEDERILTKAHLSAVMFGRLRGAVVQPTTRVKIYDANGKVVPEPNPESADPGRIEQYNLLQNLLYEVLWRRASEADLTPTDQQMATRLIVDGVLSDLPGLSLADGDAVIQYAKQIAGMDVEDRRRPQQGGLSVDVANKPVDIVLSIAGSTTGQRMQLRIVQEAIRQDLGELGLTDEMLADIRRLAAGTGIILVSGPPRNGVTSTLYSLLREQDAYVKQLVTLEAKVVSDLENVTQQAYGTDDKLAEMLAPAIRHDPDVIMVDKCPDEQTALLIIDAAENKLVLVGMGARDSFSALAKWVRVCGDAKAAVANLRGTLCQVLLRKICQRCRESYHPDPQLLAKANIPADKVGNFFRPPSKQPVDEKGNPIICSACQGTGYLGRTGAFELLEVTDEIRQMVVGGSTLREIKAACRKNKMLYLQEQALRKVIAGQTSVKEVLRVSQRSKKK